MTADKKELVINELSSILDNPMTAPEFGTKFMMTTIMESQSNIDPGTSQKTSHHTGKQFLLLGIIPREFEQQFNQLLSDITKFSQKQ